MAEYFHSGYYEKEIITNVVDEKVWLECHQCGD